MEKLDKVPRSNIVFPENDKHKVAFKLPKLTNSVHGKIRINYKQLDRICSESFENDKSVEKPHEDFMRSYPLIFTEKSVLCMKRAKWQLSDRILELAQAKTFTVQETDASHDIGEHLTRLRCGRVSPSAVAVKEARIKAVRKLIRKQPFDRSKEDNRQLFLHLRPFRCFSKLSDKHLQTLCPHAALEKWTKEEEGFTVFASSALYIILKGSVTTTFKDPGQTPAVSCIDLVPESHCQKVLYRGDWFGTLEEIDDTNYRSRVITVEPCEFLRINADAYKRVIKTLKEKELHDKLDTLQMCPLFSSWPTLSLKNVCEWLSFEYKQPKEVLGKESCPSDFLYIIKEGECVVKKTLNIARVSHNADKQKRRKTVAIGSLGPGDSVGQESIIGESLLDTTTTCRTAVTVAALAKSSLQYLDDVTMKLCKQRYEDLESKTSTDLVASQYVENQIQEDWKRYKNRVVEDVIHYQCILPGQSKWSRNPKQAKLYKV